jgi:hypothetical protein
VRSEERSEAHREPTHSKECGAVPPITISGWWLVLTKPSMVGAISVGSQEKQSCPTVQSMIGQELK